MTIELKYNPFKKMKKEYLKIQTQFGSFLFRKHRKREWWRRFVLGRKNYNRLLDCFSNYDLKFIASFYNESEELFMDRLVQAHNKFMFFKNIL